MIVDTTLGTVFGEVKRDSQGRKSRLRTHTASEVTRFLEFNA
jgi:hypothetical protein